MGAALLESSKVEVDESSRAAPAPALEFAPSRHFPEWLAEQNLSLAFTTYQAGKLFFIGLQPDGRPSIFERTFNRCMGLVADGQSLWMSSLWQIWRFENVLSPGETHQGYDRVFVPQVGYTTGDIDAHDIGIDGKGAPVFVNTLFSCLATVSNTHSFRPIWKPPFISRLVAEDRCHMNGLAMSNGEVRYVTAVGETDVTDGWRDTRRSGGIVIDVRSSQVITNGLSMPHSPRMRGDDLWLLNSGTGHLGKVNARSGRFEPVIFCPGYLRGLTILDKFAIVGLSRTRENRTFSGLELEDNLSSRRLEPRSGLMIIDLERGEAVHWLEVSGIVHELYDVIALPGARRPMAIGFKTDEIRRILTVDEG